MKQIFGILLLIGLCACNSTLSFDFPESESRIYGHCLFSPDSAWSVTVAKTYTFMNSGYNNGIDNATVFIVDEVGDTLKLHHNKDGEYLSDGEKPKEGVYYSLYIMADGDTISSTPSCVPTGVEVDVTDVNENPGTVKTDFYSMDDMCAITCHIAMEKPGETGLLVQNFLYDSIRGVGFYTFNAAVYDSIASCLDNTEVVDLLLPLDGDTIYGFSEMDAIMQSLLGDLLSYSDIEKVKQFSYLGKTYERKMETMWKLDSFTDCIDFRSLMYYKDALLGQFNATSEFNVYVDGLLEGEYWAKLSLLSPEAYAYYDGYLVQLDSRVDYSNIQNPVYSNMSNGLGIFAGIKEEWVKVK